MPLWQSCWPTRPGSGGRWQFSGGGRGGVPMPSFPFHAPFRRVASTGESPTGEAPTGEAPTGEAPTGEAPTPTPAAAASEDHDFPTSQFSQVRLATSGISVFPIDLSVFPPLQQVRLYLNIPELSVCLPLPQVRLPATPPLR